MSKCNHGKTKVIESRHSGNGGVTRRRQCLLCGERFSTLEVRLERKGDETLKSALKRQVLEELIASI